MIEPERAGNRVWSAGLPCGDEAQLADLGIRAIRRVGVAAKEAEERVVLWQRRRIFPLRIITRVKPLGVWLCTHWDHIVIANEVDRQRRGRNQAKPTCHIGGNRLDELHPYRRRGGG